MTTEQFDGLAKILTILSPVALALIAYFQFRQNQKLGRVEQQTDGLAKSLAEVTGQATLSARTWGVSVSIEMSGLTGDGPFVLTVSDAGGRTEQACVWGPTPTGNARVTGASSMQLGSVSAVSITDREGRMLATATL